MLTFQSFFCFHFQMSKQGILTIANHDIVSLKLKCDIFHNRTLFVNGFSFKGKHYFQGWKGKKKIKRFWKMMKFYINKTHACPVLDGK